MGRTDGAPRMPDLELEQFWRDRGLVRVAGIDEAGRGPLAGPLSVAAVVLPDDFSHPLLNDSKKLTEKQREAMYDQLVGDERLSYCAVHLDAGEIDRSDILRATWRGMAEAFLGLSPRADFALIDGKPVRDFPANYCSVVGGDRRCLSIAAASVIAKVERDRLMRDFALTYPGYGFERHKGYGTREHLEALASLGPCPIHRRSFAPVAARIG